MYAPLSADVVLATPITNGTSKVVRIDIPSRTWTQVVDSDTISQVLGNSVCRVDSKSALVVGLGAVKSSALHLIDTSDPSHNREVRTSSEDAIPSDYISRPETIHIHSKGSPARPIYGFLWMPRNPKFSAPTESPPPLIIRTHGGPTSHTGGVVLMSVQYYTSRGYAFLEVNYTGSTGHGRDYRQRLLGNWGIVDRDDVMEMAEHLIAQGRVGKVGITGGSAGGYATLQTLTEYSDRFAGGVCVAGVSDLSGLDRATHKVESDYLPSLVLKDPKNTTEEEKEMVYRERSALYRSDHITSPLLLIHGEEDPVVPVDQARSIAAAMEKNNAEVKLVTVPGEGHMFQKPASQVLEVEETEKWWKKTLLD